MKKYVFGLLTGLLISGGIVYAATLIDSKDVTYTPSDSSFDASNVESALNKLYDKINGLDSGSSDELVLTPSENCTLSFDNTNYAYITHKGSSSFSQGGSTTGVSPVVKDTFTAYNKYFNLSKVSELNFTYSIGASGGYNAQYKQSGWASASILIQFLNDQDDVIWQNTLTSGSGTYTINVAQLISLGYNLSKVNIKVTMTASAGNPNGYSITSSASANVEKDFTCTVQ